MPHFVRLNPKNLKDHPRNKELYGDTLDQHVLESVQKAMTIDSPLLVTANNTIISGHQRKKAALAAGLDLVPCVVRDDLEDELTILETLLRCNEQREKTAEQRAREFAMYKEIEAERAKKRLVTSTGGKSPKPVEQGVVNSPQAEKPSVSRKSREIAAQKVGWTGQTAERASKVVSTIDTLKKEGKIQDAESLREKLNTQSVNAAYKEVVPKPEPPAKPKSVLPEINTTYTKIVKALGEAARGVDKLNELRRNTIKQEKVQSQLNGALMGIKEWVNG